MYYITTLTSLFEGAALIVDQHQLIVEKYYGRGKMITVVRKLVEECDRVVSRLAEGWEEERSLKRKVLLLHYPVAFEAHVIFVPSALADVQLNLLLCRFGLSKARITYISRG